MERIIMIRRKTRQAAHWEIAEYTPELCDVVITYHSIATFSDYQEALDFLLLRRLKAQPIDFAIDSQPGKETR